jgi:hypothetical protein
MGLLKSGHFPESVHFDVKRYEIDEVCGQERDKNKAIDASNWLTNLWKEKEQRLKDFYENSREFKPSGEGFKWPVSQWRFVQLFHIFSGHSICSCLFCNICFLDIVIGVLALFDLRLFVGENLRSSMFVILPFLDVETQRRVRIYDPRAILW